MKLNKAFYVRSKISYYPLCHSILPVPDGMSAVIFDTKEDIAEFFKIRGVDDPENFEILRVTSFYDFMREVADMGFIGIWYFNNLPLLFGNYVSDIDLELPSFAYTYQGNFIGASGIIERPSFIPWQNYAKTDKIIRRFTYYISGVPFDPKDDFFTIAFHEEKHRDWVIVEGVKRTIPYARFGDASPLQGPYVSDDGAHCLFTAEQYAQRFLATRPEEHRAAYRIEKVPDLKAFLAVLTDLWPGSDIGINPENERYLQGYFLSVDDEIVVRTVIGVYRVSDSGIDIIENFDDIGARDTIERPNTLNSSLRNLQSTVRHPLKSVVGTTRSVLPRREAQAAIRRLLDQSESSLREGLKAALVEEKDISSDSFLVYAFDKITGDRVGNCTEVGLPFVFGDIVDAILYFYRVQLPFDLELARDGFVHCTGIGHNGSHDDEREQQILREKRLALTDLLETIFAYGYKVEHAELLKSFINRTSLSLEIEACGYLCDLAIYGGTLLDSSIGEDDDDEDRITKLARRCKEKAANSINLDDRYQNRIRICLGRAYNNLSTESLLILESAIKEFEGIQERTNHDYAGISMKLCKVFERELNRLIFESWKDKLLSTMKKAELKKIQGDAEKVSDQTTVKLIGWILKKNKLELGPMTFVIERLAQKADNLVLSHFEEYIRSNVQSRDFLFSRLFVEGSRLISTRYRNGGVHEKIVTYEICKESFDVILTHEKSLLRLLAGESFSLENTE